MRTYTLHLVSYFVCYNPLHITYQAFSLSLAVKLIPKLHMEVMWLPYLMAAMDLGAGLSPQ